MGCTRDQNVNEALRVPFVYMAAAVMSIAETYQLLKICV
jgi:hypothetical protein